MGDFDDFAIFALKKRGTFARIQKSLQPDTGFVRFAVGIFQRVFNGEIVFIPFKSIFFADPQPVKS